MPRTRTALRLGLLTVLALVAAGGRARAADVTLPGKILLIKNTKVVKVVSKAITPFTLPTPGGPSDPTANASSLLIDDLGGAGTLTEADLATGSWRGLGSPAGSKGYVYTNSGASAGPDPVKKIVLKEQVVKILAKDDGTLDGPAAGAVKIILTVGTDAYCAQFGGTSLKNQSGLVKRKEAAAPADCALPLPPVCGNGVTEAPDEECDDGGTTPGDGCDDACQLESTNPALCAGVPSTAGTTLDSVLVTDGLSAPVHVTAPRLDPNRLFIVEQGGTIRIVKNGVLLGTPFLDLTGDVSTGGEQGLLSMAFDPDYEANGYFYVSYTAPTDAYAGGDCPGPGGGGDNVVARFQVSGDPDVADESSQAELLRVDQPYGNHNGGQITFNRPQDQYLFFGVGDGGGGGDPCDSGQNASQRLGKLLRLDTTATFPVTPDTWAIGLRNPWRFSFDRGNGDLYIGDVGQNDWEEVDYQAAPTTSGADYQWNDQEGRHCFDPGVGCLTDGTPPVLEYDHGDGCSITGGFAYRGCAMPDVQGRYFYSDICSGFIRSFSGVLAGDAQNLEDNTADVDPDGPLSIGGVSTFGEDARGELYIVDYGDGEVFKLIPGP